MIVENYILEKCLGKGAFGEVYLTTLRDDKTKKFATKKLDRNEIERTEAVKYLKNEIQILQKLNHPNIVKFENIKKSKKHFYLIMEYCNGGELSKALEKYQEKYGKPFSQEIVQYLMRQIISAFKYIHENKVIHRDIKLDNILLNFESEEDKKELNMMKAQVKIIDFGFACLISKSGLLYSTLGSPINMDPIILKKLNSNSKKARQLGYDQKADIWSIGTICYEMLIGKSAFSFINGMLQYESSKRLNSEQLSQHPFITKDIKDFHPIDMQKVSKKVDNKGLNIDFKRNKTIWAIFNEEDEKKLAEIDGKEYEQKSGPKRLVSQENVAVNNDKLDPKNIPIKRGITAQIDAMNLNEEGKHGVMLPSKGIPDNPTNQNIQSFQEGNDQKGAEFSFSGGIFDF